MLLLGIAATYQRPVENFVGLALALAIMFLSLHSSRHAFTLAITTKNENKASWTNCYQNNTMKTKQNAVAYRYKDIIASTMNKQKSENITC